MGKNGVRTFVKYVHCTVVYLAIAKIYYDLISSILTIFVRKYAVTTTDISTPCDDDAMMTYVCILFSLN